MEDVKIIDLPKILDSRGNLSFLQEGKGLPFEPVRVFWTFNVPGGSIRGGHAYKTLAEVIVAVNGSFDILIKSKAKERLYTLNRSYQALYVPAGIWRQMLNFSTNGTGLHILNGPFNENEYVRENIRDCDQG